MHLVNGNFHWLFGILGGPADEDFHIGGWNSSQCTISWSTARIAAVSWRLARGSKARRFGGLPRKAPITSARG